MALTLALLVALGGGCGPTNCSYQILQRLVVGPVVGCCGGAGWDDVSITVDDADVDLAAAKYVGPAPSVHAWLTTTSCARLFEGEYPAAIPVPLCTVYLGPVAPGEISSRRKLPRGAYRVWVQAFTSSPETVTLPVDVGVWGERCGGL